jgi:hypothetical protein
MFTSSRTLLGHVAPFIAALALHGSEARASPNYTDFLQLFLSLESEPACTLCHRDDDGGDETVDKPFGLNAILLGATGDNDTRALEQALREMYERDIDSDGDGVADVDELQEGGNPNVGARLEPPAEPSATAEPPTGEAGQTGSEPNGGSGAPSHGLPEGSTAAELPGPTMQTGCSIPGTPGRSDSSWALGWALGLCCWRVRAARPARQREADERGAKRKPSLVDQGACHGGHSAND